MPDIILTVGRPDAVKTIWSKLYIENHNAKRLNRDDMRLMMQNGDYGTQSEKIIKRIRDYAVECWLNQGYDVVIDDTNLTPDVFPAMQEIARRVGDVGVKEHVIHIEREVCWYNNTHRVSGVIPADAWNALWLKYTQFEKHDDYYAPPRAIETEMFLNEYDITELPMATIVDLDRTLALHVHGRDPYDHSRIPDDLPNQPLADTLALAGGTIIIVTGRSIVSEEATKAWLEEHDINYDLLYMRPLDEPDTKDYELKRRIYEEYIKGKYFVQLCMKIVKELLKCGET